MPLANYTKKFQRRNGGIRLIGLVDRRDVVSITYSEAEKGFTDVTLDDDCYFSKFEFREDDAEYRERVVTKDGAATVVHELSFSLERMSPEAASAVESLIEVSRSGLIAVIVTAAGESMLVGYTSSLGMERPLRIASADASTGRLLSEVTSESVTLRCEDLSKARPLLDDPATLFGKA